MKKFFLLGVTLCAVAAAAPRARVLNYYSTGEPLQHALDYAFGSFGLRFTAPPEVLAAPWYGEFSGSVTGDTKKEKFFHCRPPGRYTRPSE